MRKIRVLVVDDSVVIRRILTDILNQEPDIEVVGTAPNGRIALSKLPQLHPDIVTLDIEMPEMDGLETLSELRKVDPTLPVIMFSSLSEHGTAATLEALARGATDYVAKPTIAGTAAANMQSVREHLVPKIRAFCSSHRSDGEVASPLPAVKPVAAPLAPCRPPARKDIIVIGASTGGPQALTSLLSELPANFPAPIVVVQHMPPVFTKHLATRLDQECELEVLEAAGGETIHPGQVFIAPGNFHLELARVGTSVTTSLHQGPQENSCRPAVDVLFRSAANLFGPACLAVVLTGMGRDGFRGGQQIVQAGGTLIAQDEASSVVWGMPRAVVEAGLASNTLPLGSMAAEIVRYASFGRRREIAMKEAL